MIKLSKRFLLIFFFLFFTFSSLNAKSSEKKKVLYINSYHTGLYWSDGIERAIEKTIKNSKMPIVYKRFEMDTKRNSGESFKLKIAKKVKEIIDEFKPDLVITSDDNAAKYVIVPYFKDSSIPFVFCGINDSADKYGFPTKNITGMVEVQLVSQIVKELKKHAKGEKIAYLKGDTFSSIVTANSFEKQLGMKIEKRFVSSAEEWMKNYLELQDSADIVLIGSGAGIKNWNEKRDQIRDFVIKHTKVPSGSWISVVDDLALISYANKPQEQGEWAAKTAIDILNGKDISTIPIVENQKATIHINTKLGKKLNIVFPFDIIDNALIVE